MTALEATRATRIRLLFSEIGLLKSNITQNQELIGEYVLLALETTFNDLISLKENSRTYDVIYVKAFNKYQEALNNAHCYVKHSNTKYVLDDLVY
jgi:hypothetical protein